MLVLSRKPKEVIQIGDNITVTLVRVRGQMVRLGIEAPRDVRIVRGELLADSPMDSSPTTPGESATDSPGSREGSLEHERTEPGITDCEVPSRRCIASLAGGQQSVGRREGRSSHHCVPRTNLRVLASQMLRSAE